MPRKVLPGLEGDALQDPALSEAYKTFRNAERYVRNRRLKQVFVHLGAGTVVLAAAIILIDKVSESLEPSVPESAAEARQIILQTPDQLRTLGLCAPELEAEVSLIRFKAEHDLHAGIEDEAMYANAAQLAKDYLIDCGAAGPEAAVTVTLADSTTHQFNDGFFVSFNAADICYELAADRNTLNHGSSEYAQYRLSVGEALAKTVGAACA